MRRVRKTRHASDSGPLAVHGRIRGVWDDHSLQCWVLPHFTGVVCAVGLGSDRPSPYVVVDFRLFSTDLGLGAVAGRLYRCRTAIRPGTFLSPAVNHWLSARRLAKALLSRGPDAVKQILSSSYSTHRSAGSGSYDSRRSCNLWWCPDLAPPAHRADLARFVPNRAGFIRLCRLLPRYTIPVRACEPTTGLEIIILFNRAARTAHFSLTSQPDAHYTVDVCHNRL